MKNLIYCFVGLLLLASCKKGDTSPNAKVQKTWIIGGWKSIYQNDTTYTADGKIATLNNGSSHDYPFTCETATTGSSVNSQPLYYSLETMTMTVYNRTWTIQKINDKELILRYHTAGRGIAWLYDKEN